MNQAALPPWIISLEQATSVDLVGTKAFNLNQLKSRGFNVPHALVIPTFDAARLNIKTLSEFTKAIEDFSHHLSSHIPSKHGWAVRSSGTVEDLKDKSMAGRFDTHFINKAEDLTEAVQKVWESGKFADIGAESMGVIVQQLIDADFGGVGFSKDPTQDTEHSVIEMCPGKAARLVDGEVTPWRVNLDGSSEIKLPDNFKQSTLHQIDSGIKQLADDLKYSVDVEWAVKDHQLFWLQVRPMTGKPVAKFEIDNAQKKELSGLWVRMQHCFSPQKPLLVSLNPGGYFNFPQWQSQLVNQFHYIKLFKQSEIILDQEKYDEILDQWDEFEEQYHAQLDERLHTNLKPLSATQLWQELEQGIILKQAVYKAYMDENFLYIRQKTENEINDYIKTALEDDPACLAQLLKDLNSKTDDKQKQLNALANSSLESENIQTTQAWQQFIENYGYESASSQLFYIPTLKETPELIIDIIDNITKHKDTQKQNNWQQHADSIREKLPQNMQDDFILKLNRLRRCMKRTEDDDYLLQKATAVIRYTLLAIAQYFKDHKILNETDDIFFLQADELKSLLNSKSVDSFSQQTIDKRKQTFEQSKRLSPPAMIVNGRPMNPKTKAKDGVINGVAASPGMANGTVIILNDPFSCSAKTLPKNAIIVAPIITPSFAYSLMGCAAVITETGGMASHGAIVAREMGIPAVVGIKGARELLQTGMKVTVDGTLGQVIIT